MRKYRPTTRKTICSNTSTHHCSCFYMLAHNVCHREFNPHSLLCQVQSSPLVKLHVLAGRGGISERHGVPPASFQPQCWSMPITIPTQMFPSWRRAGFVEAILLRLQRGFTSRQVRTLKKSWLEGISKGQKTILIFLNTGLLPATDEVSRDLIQTSPKTQDGRAHRFSISHSWAAWTAYARRFLQISGMNLSSHSPWPLPLPSATSSKSLAPLSNNTFRKQGWVCMQTDANEGTQALKRFSVNWKEIFFLSRINTS